MALITGTGGGQGRAAALRFAQEGAEVVGCDLDADGARHTAELVRQSGHTMLSLQPIDLTESGAVQRFVDAAIEHFGGVDILYNNAASMRLGSVPDLDVADFEWTMRHEVSLILHAVKAALPAFRRRGGGSIVNTASTAGIYGAGLPGNARGMIAHCVGKAAVIRMTQVLAIELSPLNIRVNAISPGVTDTPALRAFLDDPEVRDLFSNFSLLRMVARPEDVVNAAVFLASDEASLITGVNLPVDGGQSAGAGQGQPDAGVEAMLARSMGVTAEGS